MGNVTHARTSGCKNDRCCCTSCKLSPIRRSVLRNCGRTSGTCRPTIVRRWVGLCCWRCSSIVSNNSYLRKYSSITFWVRFCRKCLTCETTNSYTFCEQLQLPLCNEHQNIPSLLLVQPNVDVISHSLHEKICPTRPGNCESKLPSVLRKYKPTVASPGQGKVFAGLRWQKCHLSPVFYPRAKSVTCHVWDWLCNRHSVLHKRGNRTPARQINTCANTMWFRAQVFANRSKVVNYNCSGSRVMTPRAGLLREPLSV